ncbi:unnamed protein product [Closterium sp. NIES-54]
MYLVVVVVSLLSLRASQPSVMAQMPSNMPGGQIGGEAGIERAMSLFRVWYGRTRTIYRPRAWWERDLWEHQFSSSSPSLSTRLSPPALVSAFPPFSLPMFPRACLPPNTQVRGSDADNLPLTRVVQRDLWEHQLFHGSCDGKRLLVVPWPDKTHHGVGSQVGWRRRARKAELGCYVGIEGLAKESRGAHRGGSCSLVSWFPFPSFLSPSLPPSLPPSLAPVRSPSLPPSLPLPSFPPYTHPPINTNTIRYT